MSKREIIAAAKRKGLTVESAHYGWSATPGEMVPGWEVQFGPEIDELFCEAELQYFDSTSEALQWLDALVALPPRPDWKPIAGAPQDGARLMLWDSVSGRPVFGSWRGDNPAITHYAAEPVGPEVA